MAAAVANQTARQMILVTGGAGFIGSNLVRRLLADGHDVTVVDDLSTGSLDNLPVHEDLDFIRADIARSPWVAMLPYEHGFTHIYHLACPASPKAYQSKPLVTLETAILGTMAVLQFAKTYGARVLIASTSEVYGDPLVTPQAESYRGNVNPVGPRSCYDEGKRVAETFAYEYCRLGVDVKIARIFNTYGPYMQPDDGRVISNFMVQAIRGEPLTIYGNGSQTRSFCYVDDTVEGLIRLMASRQAGPINIGNPHAISLNALVWRLSRIFDRPLTTTSLPLPADDPKQRCPDISLAIDRLEWEPRIDLNAGLRRTAEYFRGCVDTSDHGQPAAETGSRSTG